MTDYDKTLKAARKIGSVQQTDAQAMAVFCADVIQTVAGAVSPRLVWEGAQRRGLSTEQLGHLAAADPLAVAELQWEST